MTPRRLLLLFALLACGCTASGPAAPPAADSSPAVAAGTAADTRPAHWAQPLARPGLPNLHRVSDTLYRGAQPEPAGIPELKALGIRTIVNLRGFHSDRDEIDTVAIGYEHITFNTWHPEHQDMVRFLKIVSNPDSAPVFVHCQHGADRTGTMVALYRIAVQGWNKEDAIREMTQGGFNFHNVWSNLLTFIRALDIDRVKRDAGLIR